MITFSENIPNYIEMSDVCKSVFKVSLPINLSIHLKQSSFWTCLSFNRSFTKGSRKKSSYISGPATEALPSTPLSLLATFLGDFFYTFKKSNFLLSTKKNINFLRLP